VELSYKAVDQSRAAYRREGSQVPDYFYSFGVYADLLVGLSQCGLERDLAGVQPPTRERNLATVRPQMRRAAGEDNVGFSFVVEQKAHHGGRAGARPLR
jgi:hypothetical protein